MKKYVIAFIVVLASVLGACIKNDIPYPRIQANFTALEARGQDEGTVIDTVSCTATITFPGHTGKQNHGLVADTRSPNRG